MKQVDNDRYVAHLIRLKTFMLKKMAIYMTLYTKDLKKSLKSGVGSPDYIRGVRMGFNLAQTQFISEVGVIIEEQKNYGTTQ